MSRENRDLTGLLGEDSVNIVITGDSLSYNRYDFDEIPCQNAYECYPGILSWSFMLRDAIHQNDSWYVFGDELKYSGCTGIAGNAPEFPYTSKYSCLNHGKSITFEANKPGSEPTVIYKHLNTRTNKGVLYLQKRPDRYACVFDVYLDGSLVLSGIDTDGQSAKFKGWEMLEVELPIPGDGKEHEISFRSINCGPDNVKRITIAGIGTKHTFIHLTGRGGVTTQFILDNIHERVLQYNPQLFMFIIGANDRVYLDADQFEFNLRAIVNRVKELEPACEILLITPPSSENVEGPGIGNSSLYINDSVSRKYTERMAGIAQESACMFLDVTKLFMPIPVNSWRFDNVHFTKYGNTVLSRAILEMIMPQGLYRKELVDAESWFCNANI